MNIFVLHMFPSQAAREHCDKHVIKMILESCQLLSTAHRLLDGEMYVHKSESGRNLKRWRLPDERDDLVYQATHMNHPCAVWCRVNTANYMWLWELTYHLAVEYTLRYGKIHKCEKIGLIDELKNPPGNLKVVDFKKPESFALAMPDEYKDNTDPVASYRNYYLFEKEDLLYWRNRSAPSWVGKALIKRNKEN